MARLKASQLPVILVDDEEEVLFSTSVLLKTHGIGPVITLEDGRELLQLLEERPAGAVVLDLIMPHIPGTELLPYIMQSHPHVPVVVMTASQDAEVAVACMKEGAFDYLIKPVEESRFVSSIRRALQVRHLQHQVEALRGRLLGESRGPGAAFAHIITNSPRMEAIFHYIEAIRHSSEPILIMGETGVGKGLIAQAAHMATERPGAFVTVNIAGLDDNMFSDTLFGHRRGAFSGADREREGLVAQAAEGTLFLDEIGDLGLQSQVKLLRLLQERSYYPLGSDLPRISNARIIAATNQDLAQRMAERLFRQDLFFRLSAHRMEVPPLRERLEDIPLLVGFFLEEAASEMKKPLPEPTPELLTLLANHHFPGNVRELRAMIFDAVARHKGGPVIAMKNFKTAIRGSQVSSVSEGSRVQEEIHSVIRTTGRFPTLKEAENLIIQEALRQTGGNQGIAAMLLGVSRPALNRRLMRLKAEQIPL